MHVFIVKTWYNTMSYNLMNLIYEHMHNNIIIILKPTHIIE